jgi:hypothetical protein
MRRLPLSRREALIDAEEPKSHLESGLTVIPELFADENENAFRIEVFKVLLELHVVLAAVHEVAVLEVRQLVLQCAVHATEGIRVDVVGDERSIGSRTR